MAKQASKKSSTKKTARKATKKRGASKPKAAKKKTRRASASAGAKGAARRSRKATPKKRTTSKKKATVKRAATKKAPTKKNTTLKKALARSGVRDAPQAQGAAPVKRPKSRLGKKDLEIFRQLLLAKRARLMGDVTGMTDMALRRNRQNAAGDLSNMPIHMADLGSDNFEQEFTLGLIENEHVVLREIDEALQRIDDGTYGICLGTDKPISKARLKAKPWAKYCIEYAQRLERGF